MQEKKQKYNATVTIHYELESENRSEAKKTLEELMLITGFNNFDIVIHKKGISEAQNRALHLYFTLLSEALNDAGFDMKKTIKESIDINWTPYSIKEYLWRPLQESKLGKSSTTQLKRDEIDTIYDEINKVIGERTGVYVPFPCIEELMNKKR